MPRDLCGMNVLDVPNHERSREVGAVRAPRKFAVLTREYTPPAGRFEADAEAADAREEICERERRRRHLFDVFRV